MDLQIHFAKHRRGQADSNSKSIIRSKVDDMVIHVKITKKGERRK